jgi:hypothetical protein
VFPLVVSQTCQGLPIRTPDPSKDLAAGWRTMKKGRNSGPLASTAYLGGSTPRRTANRVAICRAHLSKASRAYDQLWKELM